MDTQLNNAVSMAQKGQGVALILVDANGELIAFRPYDYSDDETLCAEKTAKELLFTLTQWLGENRYLPTSDNKSFLVPEPEALGGNSPFLDLIVSKVSKALSGKTIKQFSEFTGIDIDDSRDLFMRLAMHERGQV